MTYESSADVKRPYQRVTWELMVKLEPELMTLMSAARNADAGGDDYFCGQCFWHRKLKPRMLDLFSRYHPDRDRVLGSDFALDLAYDILWDAVPDCRDCPWCE